jgi:hypothetical protein
MATEPTDLTTLGNIAGTMTRPAALDANDRAGTEEIGAKDVRLPRLGIAQGLSYEVTPGDARFIEGLTLFDMFNDLTQEIYGKGPITFVPLQRVVRRMEFAPRSEGGGLVDPDVPVNDPRLRWSWSTEELKASGARADLPPRATIFVEFIILLLRQGKAPEPIVMSIKSTNKHNRRASDQLTTFIKLRNAAIYAGLYTVDTKVPAKNDKGTFGVPTIKNAGFIPVGTPAGDALYAFAKDFHEALKGKVVVVNREPGSDDVDPEPPAPGETEKIPF